MVSQVDPRYNALMQVTVNIPEEFVPLLVPEGADAGRKLLEDTELPA